MDERTQAENEAIKAMFETDGWRVLMRNTQAHIDTFRGGFPFNVGTLEQLYFSRGMIAALQTLLGMEDQLAAQEQEDDDDSVPWDEGGA